MNSSISLCNKFFWISCILISSNSNLFAQKANGIVEAYFKLNGGRNALCNYEKKQKLIQNIITNSGADTVVFTTIKAEGKGIMEEMAMRNGSMRFRYISICNDKQGWDIEIQEDETGKIDTTKVTEFLQTQVQEKQKKKKSFFDPCEKSRPNLSLVGIEPFNGIRAYKIIDLSDKNKTKSYHFFQVKDSQYLGTKNTTIDEDTKKINSNVLVQSDFKRTGNVIIPYKQEMYVNREKSEIITLLSETDFQIDTNAFQFIKL